MNAAQRQLATVLVLLCLPLGWYLTSGLDERPSPDELLPADTLLFAEWHDFDRFAAQVADSPLMRKLGSPDFPDTLRQLGVAEAGVSRFSGRLSLLQLYRRVPLLPELLQGRGMLALLPDRGSTDDPMTALLHGLVFILPGEAGLPPQLVGSVQERREYLGTSIQRHILSDGRDLFVCEARNLKLYAFHMDSLIHCLDQAVTYMLGGAQAAHGEKNWLQRQRQIPNSPGEFFCYADLEALRGQPRWGLALAPLAQDMGGLIPRQAAFVHTARGRERSLSATLRFRGDQLTHWCTGHGLAAPDQPPLAASQDVATLLHFWTNWFTPAMAERLEVAVSATELGAPLWAAISKFLGSLSLTQGEFYRLFAPELGLVIRGERNQNAQLKPLFSLYFKSRDEPALETALTRALRSFPIQSVELERGGKGRVVGMAGGMVRPALANVNGHLVLADNLYMLQRMERRLFQGGEEQEAPGRHPGLHVPVQAQGFLYLKNRQVAEASSLLLHYLSTARNERGVAILNDQQKLFVQQLALPFMASLGQAENSRFSVSVEGDEARLLLESEFDRALSQK